MKYCNATTISHPLSLKYPGYLKNINTIIREELGTHFPFNNEFGLDLDEMVKEWAKELNIKQPSSMDMVLGVEDNNNNKLSLLVEFKLDCKDAKNLKEGDLRDKIKDSKMLLFGSGIPVHNKYVFIFNDNLLNDVSRRILSYKLTNANGEAMSIDEFKTNYF